jgi:signal peptide peptidase SppA
MSNFLPTPFPLSVPSYRAADLVWAVWRDYFTTLDPAAFAPSPWSAPAAAPFRMVSGRGGKSLAVVEVNNVLTKSATWWGTSSVQVRQNVRQAAADPNVSGILLAIDSPGGTVAGTADLAADVRAARRQKPVWAQIQDLGASAAYWVASQADQVFANDRTALVGSVGTLMTVYDMSALAEKAGVKALVFATGPLKGTGAMGAPVTDGQQAYLQQIVDDSQASFDAAVRAGRGMSAKELAAVRTGAVFTAPQALDLKLLDGIRSLDRTLEALAQAT